MAIRPDWTAGTLTLVAGSKDFTTTGSALETAALQAGDAIITVTGYVLIIEKITGQNSGSLYSECPVDAAGDDQPLRIRYQPDGSRMQAAMRMVRELLTTGNLEAFAALVGEEDAVPVFVGPGVMKLVPKSEFGPDDQHKNLAELAAIAKANDQFVIMGADGTLTIMSIKDLTDVIAKKYQLPVGGTTDQLIDATGGATSKIGLPISSATQSALNGKADLSGATFKGIIGLHRNYPVLEFKSNNNVNRWSIIGNFTDGADHGIVFQNVRTGSNVAEIGTMSNAFAVHGNAYVGGTLSKGGGTFLIDHPLDPANKNLRHGFVEAPEYVNIYRGTTKLVDGKASVNIDDYFGMIPGTFWALNTDVVVSSLQNQDGFSLVRPDGEMSDGTVRIICEDETCTDEIAWMVTGRRNDAFVRNIDQNCERGTGRFIPEIDKED